MLLKFQTCSYHNELLMLSPFVSTFRIQDIAVLDIRMLFCQNRTVMILFYRFSGGSEMAVESSSRANCV